MEQLRAASFPVGDLSKHQVRERARTLGLATADKAESQEICFVPDGDYAKVVERLRPQAANLRGEIVDESGRVLGEHRGVHRYTVGQRHGLGISADRRLYVLRLDPRTQQVVVGDVEGLDCGSAFVEEVNWTRGEIPEGPISVRVQVRHRHKPALAEVEPLPARRALMRLSQPFRAVAPGQAAVFYDAAEDEEVIGGGWLIEGIP